MTAHPLQPTYARGEITPRLNRRVDIDHYAMALAELRNFYVLPQGGHRRRSGGRFVGRAKFDGETVRLMPFIFATDEAYCLEWGDEYVRVFANEGRTAESDVTITSITAANPAVVTASLHGYSNDDWVLITGVSGTAEINNRVFQVKNQTTNTFELYDEDGNAFSTFSLGAGSGGTANKIVEVTTPYDKTDVDKIDFAQSADIIYLACRGYAPRELQRTSATSWAISTHDFQDGPYLAENETSTTLNPSGTSGSVTVTASATTGINGGDGFQTTDVGRLIRIKYSSTWYWLKITARASTTSVTATVQDSATMSSHAATTTWKLGAWSDTTGWPERVSFFDNRLVWANNTNNPQGVWFSEVGDFASHVQADTLTDSNAITATLDTGRLDAINWLADQDGLIVGTTDAVHAIEEATTQEPFSANNIRRRRRTTFGAASVKPATIGEAIIYAGRSGKKLREYVYNAENGTYRAAEISILSEHFFTQGISEIEYAEDPDSVVWIACDCGTLVSMTYERDQSIVGFAKHPLGGTSATVESIAVVPQSELDRLWMAVDRTVDGNTVTHIEVMRPAFDADNDSLADAVFADASLTYSGSAASSVSGLDHIEGETVGILADGLDLGDVTVTSGAVTLPDSQTGETITVGLRYTSRGKSLEAANWGQRDGGHLGRKRKVSEVTFAYDGSIEFDAGSEFMDEQSTLMTIADRLASESLSSAPSLKTGVEKVECEDNWDNGGVCVWQTSTMYPATILAHQPEIEGEP